MYESNEVELSAFTTLALQRFQEEQHTPGERLEALLRGDIIDRIPAQIIDNCSRLIGRSINDFFFDPVVRYNSLCAQVFRWGIPMTENASRINSYKVGEALGAELKYTQGEAPSTKKYIIKSEDDFERLHKPDLTPLLEQDIWLINNISQRLGDNIGPPSCFMYPPFSWVATYMRDVNSLFTDLYDRPDFVHRMCRFATDIELDIIEKLTATHSCGFFMPGGFIDMLSPEQYSEFGLPYMAELINKNPNCLFYVPVPGEFQQIEELYAAIKGHSRIICMGSSISAHNPLKTQSDFEQFCSIMDSLQRPYQIAINQNIMQSATPETVVQEVAQQLSKRSKQKIMFRTDTIDPSTPSDNIDAFTWAIKRYGTL